MSRNVLIAALILPLLALVLGIVRAEQHFAHSKRWTFEVTGYDPRDLLRGHYIDYRLVLDQKPGAQSCDEDFGERCCLCLSGDASGVVSGVERTTCENARPRCAGILQTRYLSELQRYYIPEAKAAQLTQRFQDAASKHHAQLVVAIDAGGKPQIDALLIDGQRIEPGGP